MECQELVMVPFTLLTPALLRFEHCITLKKNIANEAYWMLTYRHVQGRDSRDVLDWTTLYKMWIDMTSGTSIIKSFMQCEILVQSIQVIIVGPLNDSAKIIFAAKQWSCSCFFLNWVSVFFKSTWVSVLNKNKHRDEAVFWAEEVPLSYCSVSFILFQGCSCDRCFPPAGTCEDSARSEPRDDQRFCWWTVQVRLSSLQWMTPQIFPHHHGKGVVSSVPSRAEEGQQSYCLVLTHFSATRSRCTVFVHKNLLTWKWEGWSASGLRR